MAVALVPAAAGAQTPAPAPSSRLLDLLESSREQRATLTSQESAAQRRLDDLDRTAKAAQAAVDARVTREETLLVRVTEAKTALDRAEGQVRRLGVDAAAAGGFRLTPPPAYPPPKGLRPADTAAKLNAELAAARRSRDSLVRRLQGAERDVGAAAKATAAARDAVATRTQQMEEARGVVDGVRRQLDALNTNPQVTTALADTASAKAGAPVVPTGFALGDIPADYLALYMKSAATCSGLSWTILAAIGKVETSHGQSNLPGVKSGANFMGAMGPMQFLGETWNYYGVDGNGDGVRNAFDPNDAIPAAAKLLCSNGAGDPKRLWDAIWNYNHADWYVEGVLELAARYAAAFAEQNRRGAAG